MMAIEMGAKEGLFASDNTTYTYLQNWQFTPKGDDWHQTVIYWDTLKSNDDVRCNKVVTLDAQDIAPLVTRGTSLGQLIAVNQVISAPELFRDPVERNSAAKALAYMDLQPGIRLTDVTIGKVFIGLAPTHASKLCALPSAYRQSWPGVGPVKVPAKAERLDRVFLDAGF